MVPMGSSNRGLVTRKPEGKRARGEQRTKVRQRLDTQPLPGHMGIGTQGELHSAMPQGGRGMGRRTDSLRFSSTHDVLGDLGQGLLRVQAAAAKVSTMYMCVWGAQGPAFITPPDGP